MCLLWNAAPKSIFLFSNPDLTNSLNYETEASTQDVFNDTRGSFEPSSVGNNYYDTLPKNLRRGVQKKLERNAANVANTRHRTFDEQIVTSGESDSTDSVGALPKGSGLGSGKAFQLNRVQAVTPIRSVSSMESSYNESQQQQRKPPNYFSKKFKE